MNIAFAGFRHGHITSLWKIAKNNPDVKITGAWEADAATRIACEKTGIEFNYTDYDALLADDSVEVVAIGDYYGIRGTLAIAALEAGKHVIADKPLCTSLEEIDKIEQLSKEKGLSVFSMFSMRYGPNATAVKELVNSGKLGKIHSVYFGGQHPLNYGVRPMWYFEEGKHGGTINDIAIHGIDYLNYTLGLRPAKINSARCWNAFAVQHPDFKDSAQFMLELDNGAGVVADVSYAAPTSFAFGLPTYWLFMVWGSEGLLKFTAGSGDVDAYFQGAKETLKIKGTSPNANYLTDLMAEISGGKPKVLSTADTISSTRDTLKIQLAADTAL